MTDWYYYNKDGGKVGPISTSVLEELTRQGLITPETKIEQRNAFSIAVKTAVIGCALFLAFVGGALVGEVWRVAESDLLEAAIEALNKDLNIAPDVLSFHLAAVDGNLAIVKGFVATGADVNSRIFDGATPLHAAAFRGHFDVVEYLVSHGADVHAKDSRGRTPLDMATENKNVAIAQYLERTQ